MSPFGDKTRVTARSLSKSLRRNAALPVSATLIHHTAHPSRDGSCGSSRPENIRLTRLRAKSFLDRRQFRNPGRIPRRDRLDGFRLSKTAPTLRRSSRSSNPRPVLGTLARTGHRLPRLSLSPRQSLAGVFRGIPSRHGRNARLDRLVLRTHTKHRARPSG